MEGNNRLTMNIDRGGIITRSISATDSIFKMEKIIFEMMYNYSAKEAEFNYWDETGFNIYIPNYNKLMSIYGQEPN